MITLKSKKLKMLTAGVMLTLAMGLMAGCGGEKKEAKKADAKVNVGIVQLVEHPALDAANKGFIDGMASKGYKEGQNVVYDRQNAQADQSNLQNIAQRFVSNKVNLICAIATPAAQTVANATPDIPIVGTAITDYVVAKLVKDNKKPGTNVTGTTDMNPVEAQLDLALQLVPGAKAIGTIYSSSEVNSQLQVDILKKAAAVKKVEIVPLEVIIRNVAAGSFSKRLGVPEGTPFAEPTIEFSYKNDDLGDPLINSYFAVALGLATWEEIETIKKETAVGFLFCFR